MESTAKERELMCYCLAFRLITNMTTLVGENPVNTLLDHQWIHTDQASEYLKAIKERTENQLRDFCKIIDIFTCLIFFV